MSRYILPLLIIIYIFVGYLNLGKRPLERWDEQTNSHVVRELIASDNPFILYLNRKPFFEKPPLWYWLTYLNVKIMGFSAYSLRFVSVISGLGILIVIYFTCLRFYSQKAATLASLVYLSTGQLFNNNPAGFFATHNLRSADLDGLQLLFNILSFTGFLLAESFNRKYLIIAAIFCGLGFMTKGAFSLLIIPIWLVYLIKNGKEIRLKELLCNIIFPLLILIIPWYMYMTVNFGDAFIREHFIYHMIGRTVQPIEGHYGNIFFYIVRLINPQVYLFTIPLIIILYYALMTRKLREFKYYLPAAILVAEFISINLIGTKLTWYLLGMYPVAAVFLGAVIGDNAAFPMLKGKAFGRINYGTLLYLTSIAVSICGILYNIISNRI
jgi:4-amino-4-deoxy-L-arabinose transferase-like glycosyltransferase